jgi:hypothetical protein
MATPRAWRNGKRAGFRCPCSKELVGSSPSARTVSEDVYVLRSSTNNDDAGKTGAPPRDNGKPTAARRPLTKANVLARNGGGAAIAAEYRFELVAAGGVSQVNV